MTGSIRTSDSVGSLENSEDLSLACSRTMTLNAFEDPVGDEPTPETEELYSYVCCFPECYLNLTLRRSWALAILCVLLILSLWTSYYVQIKRIRAVHETVLSIFAGMFVGMVVWASPGHLIRDMLARSLAVHELDVETNYLHGPEIQTYPLF